MSRQIPWNKGTKGVIVAWNKANLPTTNELRALYLGGKSSLVLAKEYNVSNKTILTALHKIPDWNEIVRSVHSIFLAKKAKNRIWKGICEYCSKEFQSTRKRKYCS